MFDDLFLFLCASFRFFVWVLLIICCLEKLVVDCFSLESNRNWLRESSLCFLLFFFGLGQSVTMLKWFKCCRRAHTLAQKLKKKKKIDGKILQIETWNMKKQVIYSLIGEQITISSHRDFSWMQICVYALLLLLNIFFFMWFNSFCFCCCFFAMWRIIL